MTMVWISVTDPAINVNISLLRNTEFKKKSKKGEICIPWIRGMSPARVRTQQQYPIQACQRANSITPTLRGQSFRTPNRIDQSNDSGLDSLGWFLSVDFDDLKILATLTDLESYFFLETFG